jgi:hypothetical protein
VFLVVSFSTNCQHKTLPNINEHSLPATRSDVLRFLAISFNTGYQHSI